MDIPQELKTLMLVHLQLVIEKIKMLTVTVLLAQSQVDAYFNLSQNLVIKCLFLKVVKSGS